MYNLLLLCYIFMASVGVSAVEYPPCYLSCLDSLIKTAPCSPLDTYCFCTNEDSLRKFGSCICQTCSGADIQASAVLGTQVCLQAGANVQLRSCLSLSSSSSASPTSVTTTATGQSSVPQVVSSSAVRTTVIGTAFIVAAASLAAVLAL